MPTHPLAIIYFIIAAFLGALGQYLYKAAAQQITAELSSILYNYKLFAGIACYIIVMVLFVAAFKKGGELTTLYPIYASTFIWAAIIAYFTDQTPIKAFNILGMFFIILGMYFMGK